MRWRPLLIISFGGLVLLVLGLRLQYREDKTPTITLGQGNLGVVRFSEAWTKAEPTGGKTVLTLPAEYEIRKVIGSTAGELLFGLRLPDGSYSENFYAVSLDGRFTVRPAAAEEWDRAERLSKNRHLVPSVGGSQVPNDSIIFRGSEFAKSGESWGIALLSPNENRLALVSHTSKEKPRRKTIFSFLGGGEPSKGEIFLDVYDTSTGQKILAGQAPYRGFGPTVLFDRAFWGEDRYLILPLDSLLRTSLLGILPSGEVLE